MALIKSSERGAAMSETYIKYVEIMHSLFSKSFLDEYKDAVPKKRRKMLPYIHALYRRWYYATLVEHTPFSPANLMSIICEHHKTCDTQHPIPVLRTPSRVVGMDMKVLNYTADAHPAVDDLRKLMTYCTPCIGLLEIECFSDEQALEAAELLSLNDPHYASFLLEVAIEMKFLAKMPSLYVCQMQPTEKSKKILALSDREILDEIVLTTIHLAAIGLKHSMPMPENIFSASFVHNLLKSPLETDEIFGRIFEVMGYELEELIGTSRRAITRNKPSFEDEVKDDYQLELISNTFVMGIVLDRFFFTPFGHFLRLINPLYALPFDLKVEILEYMHICNDPQEAFIAFFAPCSSYTLTALGLEILEIEPNENNFFDPGEIPFEPMKESIFADDNAFETFVELAKSLSPAAFEERFKEDTSDIIYNFRIRMENKPSLWMHMQLSGNATLHDIYVECLEYFDIKETEEYSFFHDKIENRFAEYPSIKRASRAKKPRKTASQTKLLELDFAENAYMILAAYNQATPFAGEPTTLRLHIRMLEEMSPEDDQEYPSYTKMSTEMRARTKQSLLNMFYKIMDDEWGQF